MLRRKASRPDTGAMTLAEHLRELRRRVVICAVAFVVTATVAFVVYPAILDVLKAPYCQSSHGHCSLFVTGPLDGLSIRVKVAAYGGLFLASPVILWEFWRFVTPGLKPTEKRYAVPFVLASIVLFSLGCVVAYITFPHALTFLGSIGGPGLRQIYDPVKYLNLVMLLMAVFGIAFEFPVVLVSLEAAGIVSWRQLSSVRRWAIILIVVAAGVFTPSSDPFSMLALAVPLYAFYELSILIGWLLKR
ncbi:MAG: twin-arginine translocase subunit TatC [Actinomycetota bacterium]|nr:twin-arginine translocase subunit TatC [Actinomycetota bacterium]